MIKRLDRSSGKVMGMEVEGEITIGRFREIESEIDRVIKEFGQVNFLVIIKEFSGYGPKILWEDIRFAIKHWNDIGRVAIVGDKKWLEIGAKMDNFIGKWEEKFFHNEDLDQAWAWVEEK